MQPKARIGLDARMIDKKESGLGRYARALINNLCKNNEDYQYVVILRPGVEADDLWEKENIEIVRIPGWLDHPSNLITGPAIEKLKLDLYHSLHHFLPLGLRHPRIVVSLMDLIWVEHPRLTFDTKDAWLRWRSVAIYGRTTMWHAMRRADHVIAISNYSRSCAIKRYDLDPDRITTIHLGVDQDLFIRKTKEETTIGENTEDNIVPYFFSLGNSKPYKNIRNLLRAFALVSASHPEVKLFITGRGDSLKNLSSFAQQLNISNRVNFTGMVDQKKLIQLYHGAVALVFPSFIEGFGIPLVEAMATGCPVVSSDIPVVREIVGDAAVCADPNDPKAIAVAMEKVLVDKKLRMELSDKGHKQSVLFDWASCAAQTRSVYHLLLGQ